MYNIKDCKITIGTVLIQGYDEDGGVEFENLGPIGEGSTGADGITTYTFLNNKAVHVMITVRENSFAYTALATQVRLFELAPLKKAFVLAMPFNLTDLNNGDQVRALSAWPIERPVPNKARTVGSRTFKYLLKQPTRIEGAFNLPTPLL